MTEPSDDRPTPRPVGGWLLRVDQDVLDVTAMLARFGQVYRYPIDPSDDADQMAPGQPCFLFQADRSKVVGIWAVGEVVAECLLLPAAAQDHPAAGITAATDPAGQQAYAEVELLPLEKPLTLDKLLADKVLAAGPLSALASPSGAALPNPVRLEAAQVRAIGAFDFWITEPSDEQRAALDALLDAEEA